MKNVTYVGSHFCFSFILTIFYDAVFGWSCTKQTSVVRIGNVYWQNLTIPPMNILYKYNRYKIQI